jgi:hypothetical protein
MQHYLLQQTGDEEVTNIYIYRGGQKVYSGSYGKKHAGYDYYNS